MWTLCAGTCVRVRVRISSRSKPRAIGPRGWGGRSLPALAPQAPSSQVRVCRWAGARRAGNGVRPARVRPLPLAVRMLDHSCLHRDRFFDFLRKRLLLLLRNGVDLILVFDGAKLPAKTLTEEKRARYVAFLLHGVRRPASSRGVRMRDERLTQTPRSSRAHMS